MKKLSIGIFMLALVSGCQSTSTKTDTTSNADNSFQIIKLSNPNDPTCDKWVHPEKTVPTIDYQYCQFNHTNDLNACMEQRQWRLQKFRDIQACASDSYSLEEIESCITAAKVGDKLDETKFNQCFTQYTPGRARTKDLTKSLNKCMEMAPENLNILEKAEYCARSVGGSIIK